MKLHLIMVESVETALLHSDIKHLDGRSRQHRQEAWSHANLYRGPRKDCGKPGGAPSSGRKLNRSSPWTPEKDVLWAKAK